MILLMYIFLLFNFSTYFSHIIHEIIKIIQFIFQYNIHFRYFKTFIIIQFMLDFLILLFF